MNFPSRFTANFCSKYPLSDSAGIHAGSTLGLQKHWQMGVRLAQNSQNLLRISYGVFCGESLSDGVIGSLLWRKITSRLCMKLSK
jgi:hypothetical protein